MSQRHEGWELVKDRYDDGGFSGGNLERPGLKRLLADVAAGKVQVIVLYKIDRLTRSLADFSRIVDVLDKAGASFVSITQSFNTTTSMGRLMLNVLLSFAQFEREVTGERIRDKIAASKAKGMWMGGAVPLGYQVQERKLVIDEEEVATVRHIFRRYAALGSGGDLLDDLRLHGIRTKRHMRKDGLVRGGIPFTRGSLFHLLKNRVYRGEIVHKDTAYPGEHEAIIEQDLWESVQQKIVENTVDRRLRRKAREASLLSGIIFDGHGRKMCPSHTVRKAKRYRYYVTHPDKIIDDTPQWRRSAFDIEKRVIGALADYLEDQQAVRKLIGSSDASQLATTITRCQRAANQIRTSTFHRRTKVPALVARVDLGDDEIGISLSSEGFGGLLGTAIDAERLPRLAVQVTRVRRGNEVKLILTEGVMTEADETLVSLLREAMAARREILAESPRGICQFASATGRCSKRMTRLVRLSWLAPEIVDAILAGRQPLGLTARSLLSAELPVDWAGQKAALGF